MAKSKLDGGMKKIIDRMSYDEMLTKYRFAKSGDSCLQGEVGDYFIQIMSEKKAKVDDVAISKKVGW